MRVLTALKDLSSAVSDFLSPKTTATSTNDVPDANNHTKDASNINNNTGTNCFAALLKWDQRRLKDDILETVWDAELAKTPTDLDAAIKLISHIAAPKAKLSSPTRSGEYSHQRYLPLRVRSEKSNYVGVGYKDTTYMSCAPIHVHRDKVKSKPQHPPRVLWKVINYMVLPSTRIRSKMANRERMPSIPTHYSENESQTFVRTCCNRKGCAHLEHGNSSADVRASKAPSTYGIAVDTKHLDTVTKGTGTGAQQTALNNINDNDCGRTISSSSDITVNLFNHGRFGHPSASDNMNHHEVRNNNIRSNDRDTEFNCKTVIHNDNTIYSTDSMLNIRPTNMAESRGKRPNSTSNLFAAHDHWGNTISPPDSILSWCSDIDDNFETADLGSPLTIGPHDIDLAIHFIVANL